MIDPSTILGRTASTAINFNGLFVPLRSISGVLEKYTDPALFYTADLPEYPLSKSGSLVRIKYKDRYFAMTTCHQLDRNGYGYHQLVLIGTVPGVVVTSQNAYFPLDESEQREDLDCLVFEFTSGVTAGSLDGNRFLQIPSRCDWQYSQDSLAYFCIGYPSHRNNIDWEDESLSVAPNAVWGVPCKQMIARRASFKPLSGLEYEPVGMSGGPVFSIEEQPTGLRVELSGILTNGSSVTLNFLPMTEIYRLLDYATK